MKMTSLSQEEVSESRTAGVFPPSSRMTGVRCLAAADITILATLALPVNSIQLIYKDKTQLTELMLLE